GKTKEDILKSIDMNENEYLVKFVEQKGGLFKSASYKAFVYKLEDICQEIKEYLKELLANMNIEEVSFESKIREGQINIKLYSSNNSILIGKNGQTLAALQNVIRQRIYSKIGLYPYVLLDVENYKDKQKGYIERLAKNLAREVKKTKRPIEMENMNSYERRIVHNVLAEIKGVTSASEGTEPNRHVVIKPSTK
ncbi:MAG: KH domain-containing protein, partial [Bacilli bacterium]|nr:KH domain-containing protein [Bacilli bacterium]